MLFFLVACNELTQPLETKFYKAVNMEEAAVLDMAKLYTSIHWDQVLLVRPYTRAETIPVPEETKLKVIESKIRERDNFVLMVFMHEKQPVEVVKINRVKADLLKAINHKSGYSIYDKDEAVFSISKMENVIERYPGQASYSVEISNKE